LHVDIEHTKRVHAAVKELPNEETAAVDAALAQLAGTFGRPHVHAGTSIRGLRPPIYEFRATRALRVVFLHRGSLLKVDFVGTHAEVATYLRNAR